MNAQEVTAAHAAFKAKVHQVNEARKQLSEVLKADGEVFITLVCQELFDANQGAGAYIVVGYTPFFNDGDICEFGMSVIPISSEENDYDVWKKAGGSGFYAETFEDAQCSHLFEEPSDYVLSQPTQGAVKVAEELVGMEEIFRLMYTDHFAVFIYKDESGEVHVQHEEYTDHD